MESYVMAAPAVKSKINNEHVEPVINTALRVDGSAVPGSEQHTGARNGRQAARPSPRVWGAEPEAAADDQHGHLGHPTVPAVGGVAGGAARAAGAGGAGLVICATTARITPVAPSDQLISVDLEPDRTVAGKAWRPKFASPELVTAAAGLWDEVPFDGGEGPRPVVTIGPGMVSIGWHDLNRLAIRDAREGNRRERGVTLEELAEPGESTEVQTEWSRRSVALMTKRLSTLDWSPISNLAWSPAAIALTYPAKWLELAPDGRTAKKHLRTFEKRFYRAWGYEPVWVWKMEFQRRGAPHFHLLAKTPRPGERAGKWRRDTQIRYRAAVGDDLLFRQWVSVVWADVVGETDPREREKHVNAGTRVDFNEGARCRDPRRAAVYFTKHASFADKWYQNVVPEAWQEPGKGPGRFWGYKGLERATAVVTIENEDALWAKRIMRRWSKSQKVTRQRTVERVEQSTGRIYTRKVRRRAVRLGNAAGGGFLCVNDGPEFASQLVRGVQVARRAADEGACAPLPRRDQYLSGGGGRAGGEIRRST